MTPDQPSNPKSKSRWYQYSLRTLMIVVTLFAVACSWFAVKLQQASSRREAVEAIRKAGGSIFYDYQIDKSEKVIPGAEPFAPICLRNLLGDDFFYDVVYAEVSSDTALAQLKAFPQLKWLQAIQSGITDNGMQHLETLTQLKRLSLEYTQVTATGLEHLNVLPRLDRLDLRDNKILKEDLEKLQHILPNCNIHHYTTDPYQYTPIQYQQR
jgi:hypothetical protein